MKPLRKLFDLTKLAEKIIRIGKREDLSKTEPEVPVLIEKILDSPINIESIHKLFKKWGINQKEVPNSPDPATEWATFTQFLNETVALELETLLVEILDKQTAHLSGYLRFQLMLDETFGLYYIYDSQYLSPDEPQPGDLIVESMPDGSYAISEVEGEPLGMAENWEGCISYILDHFQQIGCQEDDYGYEVKAFLRTEKGVEFIPISLDDDDDDDGDDDDDDNNEYEDYEDYEDKKGY